jgi:hypothetical protein
MAIAPPRSFELASSKESRHNAGLVVLTEELLSVLSLHLSWNRAHMPRRTSLGFGDSNRPQLGVM